MDSKVIRAKAPLRIGLAGGGTDVSPYSDIYGGNVLNSTINMYAYATIKPLNNGKIIFNSYDLDIKQEFGSSDIIQSKGDLALLKGVYNRIVKDFPQFKNLSFELSTYVDAPVGSGLGTSSTLVVTILAAFAEWLKIPLSEYDLAHLAWEIERVNLGFEGGKQDQYSSAFGGFNFIEFFNNNKVIVNPLRIKQEYINELENNLVLYFTGQSRISSEIISTQIKNVNEKKQTSIDAMHNLKKQAVMMKEALLKGEIDRIGELLNFGWEYKKQMALKITSSEIDEIFETALNAGASGGKISGAGGGGFIIFYCPDNSKYQVIKALEKTNGKIYSFQFCPSGVQSWQNSQEIYIL
ncbi:MAG: GHMP kinase [Candidatus Gastranaerophilales bacterium]|nr:GHMP kinase [Candidatus Gastranaerophilales bacterium]